MNKARWILLRHVSGYEPSLLSLNVFFLKPFWFLGSRGGLVGAVGMVKRAVKAETLLICSGLTWRILLVWLGDPNFNVNSFMKTTGSWMWWIYLVSVKCRTFDINKMQNTCIILKHLTSPHFEKPNLGTGGNSRASCLNKIWQYVM